MKALSLHQPWATAVVTGNKRYETRSWPTSLFGQTVAILGKIIGVVTIADCKITEIVRNRLLKAGDVLEVALGESRP